MKSHIITVAITAATIPAATAAPHSPSYFSIRELTKSDTASQSGIDNTPSEAVVKNLNRLIRDVLDPARRQLGSPIIVNSGYRCPELNRAVGGVRNSYHLYGQAADITTGDIAMNRRLWLILQNLPHKELIWERGGTWIHVAW